jgi:hypothetical protein
LPLSPSLLTHCTTPAPAPSYLPGPLPHTLMQLLPTTHLHPLACKPAVFINRGCGLDAAALVWWMEHSLDSWPKTHGPQAWKLI